MSGNISCPKILSYLRTLREGYRLYLRSSAVKTSPLIHTDPVPHFYTPDATGHDIGYNNSTFNN